SDANNCGACGNVCPTVQQCRTGACADIRMVFSDVALGSSASQTATLAVAAGYRIGVASGTAVDAPFGFNLGTCGAGGGFTGRGTCTITATFTPATFDMASGAIAVSECPLSSGSCVNIPISLFGRGGGFATPDFSDLGDVPLGQSATATITLTLD